MADITSSIIQKVKNELQIQDDLTSTELYDLLHKYRSTQHPDKFTDKERKEAAEEKFKELNTLLYELSKHIELEKQQKNPSEIIPLKKDYEIVKAKQLIIDYEKNIKDLKLTIWGKGQKIKRLRRELQELQDKKLEEKTQELIKLYKPSKESLISQGIIFLITLIMAILTRIDEIATVIQKYSPFSPSYLNYLIFSILAFIPIRYAIQYIYEKQIDKNANRIKTSVFLNKFLNYLTQNGIKDYFTEMNVYEFLQSELNSKNKLSKFIRKHIYNIYSETTIDSLKDIFIYNLLNKQLISISTAEQFDRKFKIIKNTSSYDIDFDIDFDEDED